ncbi:DUF4245 domain-containing protein [Arthrobacter sp. Sa2CUA1]|uniref:DUF4245 domain-containing protein n=1 Tax=Arthrobacter gallicola TaxID=2762225 RepID=A0ABR8UVM7_9MICC|nr:DUF4245 domain-containing protein [Arthrobacter gallicola]MBD7996136.1 DUF4245 domain-containing protein [Arthrobacter gallicola]
MSEQQQPDEPVVTPTLTAKQAKRANATVIGMLIATGITLAIVLLPVLLNPAQKPQIRDVDVQAIAAEAAADAGYDPLAPELPDGWTSNYARWDSGLNSGVPAWEVGYLTPEWDFIRLTETASANPTWISQTTEDSLVAGERIVGGTTWQLRDGSDGEAHLVTEVDGKTVILSSEGDLATVDLLAEAVLRDLAAASGE